MALHSMNRKTIEIYKDHSFMNCSVGSTDNQYAIMVKNPLTGNDCIFTGRWQESNLIPATNRSHIKGYITKQRAEREIANIFMHGQNARVVTMEQAEIYIGSTYRM